MKCCIAFHLHNLARTSPGSQKQDSQGVRRREDVGIHWKLCCIDSILSMIINICFPGSSECERRVNFGLFRLRGIVLSVMSVVAMVEVIRPLVTVSQIGCLKRKDLLE